MRKTGFKLKQQKWGGMWRKKWRRKLKNRKENAGSEMEEKREEEWKAATREKEGNIKEYWGKSQRCNWDLKRKKGVRKKIKEEKGVKIQEKEKQLMMNLNEAKQMNEENWIETTKWRIWRNWWRNLQNRKKNTKTKTKNIVTGWEMQETIEEE